ncbi:uncharacterized protein [Onthophagus taurus]|uniref:uncharacterized protein n=1 Tax=Onthophagus taurus TaxID=166361 RepID=UPI0039BE3BC8
MADHKLSKLILRRNGYLNRLIETADAAHTVSDSNDLKLIFIARANDSEDTYKEFKTLHNQVIGLIDEADFDTHDAIRKQADESYFTIKAVNYRISSEISKPKDPPIPINSPKLNKISLPVFSGDYKSWPSFYDLYRSLVHENQSLSEVAKYQYLLTSISGEALHLVKGLPMTEANYSIAFKTLKTRYQNKRHLATLYYNEIQSVTIKQSTEGSAKAYRMLIDTFSENVEGLRTLGFPVDDWDFLLFNLLLQKLDTSIKTKFETEHSEFEIPTYIQLISFLENQSKALDSVKLTSSVKGPKPSLKSTSTFATEIKQKLSCILCKMNHNLYQCDKFLEKSPSQRFNIISDNKFCKNCLGYRHHTSKCNSNKTCRICNKRHHTLLHLNLTPLDKSSPNPNSTGTSTQPHTVASATNTVATILLPVAELDVQDRFGKYHKVRALIDTCSMINFISENLQKRLQLVRSIHSVPIEGLNNMSSNCNNGSVECYIKPCNVFQPTLHFTAVISQRICSEHPSISIDVSAYPHLQDLNISKTQSSPGPIDILLGAELVPYILTGDRRVGGMDEPAALGSIFGWLLTGRSADSSFPESNISLLVEPSLDSCLRKFWELEQMSEIVPEDPEDRQCDAHFQSTYNRTSEGRFIVSLPFRTPTPKLGESYTQAHRRYLYLERKLIKDSEIFQKYKIFMEDYLAKGHMSPVCSDDYRNENAYYIPHHYVLNPNSLKLRVVFDASAKTKSGLSLNDILLTGSKLQNNLCSILIKFRYFPIVFICDIKQMYRQILLISHQRDFQRILWRNYHTNELCEYQLNTVTYGVSSAPYLALRTIKELAKLYAAKFPEASQVLINDMYVDDVVTGSFSVRDALHLQEQIIKLLSLGGFELAKWASNCPKLMKRVCPDGVTSPVSLDHAENGFIKVLGLHWDPSIDTFGFSSLPRNDPCTKRAILSNIARIFDPLGFITPCILAAKYLIQQLWLEKCDWDDTPSEKIKIYWIQYKEQLPQLSQLRIPRSVQLADDRSIELHLFSDASMVGYCAVAYLRLILPDNSIKVNFLCARSRVAPLKITSLPRLELCGAVLLSDLAEFLISNLSCIAQPKVFAWCDSTIVLGWLKSSPHRWKTFVANRTSHIQNIIPGECWHHVSSLDNPADPGSRGLLPAEMVGCQLWWNGPVWLSCPSSDWPTQVIATLAEKLPEEKHVVAVNTTTKTDNFLLTLMERCSSLSKIKNVVAYVLRFVAGCRKLNQHRRLPISMLEKQTALHTLARQVQLEHFPDVLRSLHTGSLPAKPYRKLAPFIGEGDLIRVGGRLRHSDLVYDAKHPILLPCKSRLSELIVQHLHQENLHPGYRTLHALIANQFWIMSPRTVIYRVISRCLKCFRARPKSINSFMADLPTFRIQQMKAFTTAGVDYAGPFFVTARRHRGAKTFKAYICLFVCAATKAIHLELVSDLTAEAFLAALRRFVARRGTCIRLFSDQGTNFVGAYRQLNEYAQMAGETLGIEWLFNPPAAPNFNGLSEAGVKSAKTHLKRVIGDQVLTFEELYTLVTQIESILNSRPLCPLGSDPNDLQPLTPGHFLTLSPASNEIPNVDFQNVPNGRLSRWALLQKMMQHFWKRWSLEYLHTLQQRAKWTTPTANIPLNTVVLIKNDQQPPWCWKLGRIIQTHPGLDGVVRVVTVRTAQGELQRPVTKICPLPSEM